MHLLVKEQESAVKAVRLERLVGNIGHVRLPTDDSLQFLIFWLPLASLFATYNSFPLPGVCRCPGPETGSSPRQQRRHLQAAGGGGGPAGGGGGGARGDL